MEQYLEQFWIFLLGIFLRIDWTSRVVSLDERISRYIVNKHHMKKRISPAAFMPRTGCTSVYRTTGCAEKRVWLLGLLFVERKRRDNVKILGRADLGSKIVFDEGLNIRPSLGPHPRHANLIGWPEDKAEQKDKAAALAQAAALVLRPKP
ncbi:MAG TPA: hypothetical protein VFQ24_10060 [Terriglobia bacterium]|nr:hypothetical protein [Terriglobia bacterium]